jgi:hypothetical protein
VQGNEEVAAAAVVSPVAVSEFPPSPTGSHGINPMQCNQELAPGLLPGSTAGSGPPPPSSRQGLAMPKLQHDKEEPAATPLVRSVAVSGSPPSSPGSHGNKPSQDNQELAAAMPPRSTAGSGPLPPSLPQSLASPTLQQGREESPAATLVTSVAVSGSPLPPPGSHGSKPVQCNQQVAAAIPARSTAGSGLPPPSLQLAPEVDTLPQQNQESVISKPHNLPASSGGLPSPSQRRPIGPTPCQEPSAITLSDLRRGLAAAMSESIGKPRSPVGATTVVCQKPHHGEGMAAAKSSKPRTVPGTLPPSLQETSTSEQHNKEKAIRQLVDALKMAGFFCLVEKVEELMAAAMEMSGFPPSLLGSFGTWDPDVKNMFLDQFMNAAEAAAFDSSTACPAPRIPKPSRVSAAAATANAVATQGSLTSESNNLHGNQEASGSSMLGVVAANLWIASLPSPLLQRLADPTSQQESQQTDASMLVNAVAASASRVSPPESRGNKTLPCTRELGASLLPKSMGGSGVLPSPLQPIPAVTTLLQSNQDMAAALLHALMEVSEALPSSSQPDSAPSLMLHYVQQRAAALLTNLMALSEVLPSTSQPSPAIMTLLHCNQAKAAAFPANLMELSKDLVKDPSTSQQNPAIAPLLQRSRDMAAALMASLPELAEIVTSCSQPSAAVTASSRVNQEVATGVPAFPAALSGVPPSSLQPCPAVIASPQDDQEMAAGMPASTLLSEAPRSSSQASPAVITSPQDGQNIAGPMPANPTALSGVPPSSSQPSFAVTTLLQGDQKMAAAVPDNTLLSEAPPSFSQPSLAITSSPQDDQEVVAAGLASPQAVPGSPPSPPGSLHKKQRTM